MFLYKIYIEKMAPSSRIAEKKTKERKHHHYLEKEKKYNLMRFSFRGLFYEKIDERKTLLFKKEGIQQY